MRVNKKRLRNAISSYPKTFAIALVVKEEHDREIQTMAMVLDLCELLAELATRRASALTDCTTTTTAAGVAKQAAADASPLPFTRATAVNSDSQKPAPTKLKLVPEAKR